MKFIFNITGLDCPNCAAKLADIIAKQDAISSAKINFLTEKLTVESELEQNDLLALVSSLAKKFDKAVKVEI